MSVRGTGGPAWRVVQALLPALAAGVLVAWALAWAEGPLAAAALPALAAGAWAARRTPAPAAELAWDGQCWRLDGRPGEVQVMIDLDRWLLLRWQAGAARRWPAYGAGEAGASWPLLRAALHARRAAGVGAPPAAHV